MTAQPPFSLQCPLPLQQYTHVQMAHGGGGRVMHQLIEQMLLPSLGSNPDWQHDAARLSLPPGQLAFTTDSYVVSPLFFPGGDIGCLAVYGTVNDLAMAGARPLYLSLSFILEEGLPMETLWRVVQSIAAASRQAGIQIVTGDTKVVDRGKGDGLYINTAGVGVIEHPWSIRPSSVQPGDVLLISGDIGRHGIAILAAREELQLETSLESDCAPVAATVQTLLAEGIEIHCLRDLTRGGLATALNEIAAAAQVAIALDEAAIPIGPEVQAACEILGLDPLYIANEGCFVAFVPAAAAPVALEVLQSATSPLASRPMSAQIGTVLEPNSLTAESSRPGMVSLRSLIGSSRLLDYRSGDQLPRIC
jgi:hydrogenase expression/formation protein HypE